MKKITYITLLFVYVIISKFTFSQAEDESKITKEPRVYVTKRLSTPPPVIDGNLDDACDLNSYHDHRTEFEFNVSAAGQKVDLLLTNPMNGDENWDAVWDAKTSSDKNEWVVEYKIPLSQLRYSNEPEQTWGMSKLYAVWSNDRTLFQSVSTDKIEKAIMSFGKTFPATYS